MKDTLAWAGFVAVIILIRVYPGWCLAAGVLLVAVAAVAYVGVVIRAGRKLDRLADPDRRDEWSDPEPPVRLDLGPVGRVDRRRATVIRHARPDGSLLDEPAAGEWFATPDGDVVDRNGWRVR